MGRIFLSHSSIDKPFVRMVATDIKTTGAKIWLDEVELKVGDSLVLRIADAIGNASYVVAFLSADSISSNWVKKELAIAATIGINDNRISVLPVLIGNIRSENIPLFLADQLYIDFRDSAKYDEAFAKLLRRLKPRALPEKILNIDAFRTNYLVEMAKDLTIKDWILSYLIRTLTKRYDPSERYWSYITLAKIGGDDVLATLQKAFVEEKNELAKRGAKEGMELLGLSIH